MAVNEGKNGSPAVTYGRRIHPGLQELCREKAIIYGLNAFVHEQQAGYWVWMANFTHFLKKRVLRAKNRDAFFSSPYSARHGVMANQPFALECRVCCQHVRHLQARCWT